MKVGSYFIVRFQVLTATSMKFEVYWDVAPCSHFEVDRHFRGAYCLYHQGDNGPSVDPLDSLGVDVVMEL
jgi:hypothetical protein